MINKDNIKSVVLIIAGLFFIILAILDFSDFLKLTGNPIEDSTYYMFELLLGLILSGIGIFIYPFGYNNKN